MITDTRPTLDPANPISLARWLQWLGDRVDSLHTGQAEIKEEVAGLNVWKKGIDDDHLKKKAHSQGVQEERARQRVEVAWWLQLGGGLLLLLEIVNIAHTFL